MRLGSKRFPSNGFALAADLELTTASATVGVCTITVFLVPLSNQPAAFPTATTKTPPITAATIAMTAEEPGRARTDRTVAAKVLGADRAQTRSSSVPRDFPREKLWPRRTRLVPFGADPDGGSRAESRHP